MQLRLGGAAEALVILAGTMRGRLSMQKLVCTIHGLPALLSAVQHYVSGASLVPQQQGHLASMPAARPAHVRLRFDRPAKPAISQSAAPSSPPPTPPPPEQLLESYKSVTLASMAAAFDVSPAFLDAELASFIAAGRLGAKIDKVAGVVQTKR